MTSDSSRRGILLVDDNAMDVELTLEAFAELGLGDEIRVARSGAHALDLLFAVADPSSDTAQLLPQLVLLDLKMPGLDGFEVLRRIKASPGLGRTPVVILTSSNDEADLATCYDLGANSYLVKPVAYSGFLVVVRHIATYWLHHNVLPPSSDAPAAPPTISGGLSRTAARSRSEPGGPG